MAEAPAPGPTTAAELALGLLEGHELREAERRRAEDKAFAAQVERWERHFALLFSRWPEVEPPETALERLAQLTARNAANDNPTRPWKIATILSSAVAAVLALFLAVPQQQPPVATPAAEPRTLLANALTGPDGVTKVPVVIELPGSGFGCRRESMFLPGVRRNSG